MVTTTTFAGSFTSVSPCGEYVAFVVESKVRVCYANTPESCIAEFTTRIDSKDIARIRWSSDNVRVAIYSAKLIEVFDLDDIDRKVRFDNGGGGLGRFDSADFVGNDYLLITWDFGRAKLWNLETGKSAELGDVKTTCDGTGWQMRPSTTNGGVPSLAILSRDGAEDMSTIHFPEHNKSLAPVKLPTIDAQSIQWSPDGRWLTVLDTPTANPGLYFYTPDGHLFRSFSSSETADSSGLGIKAISWSADSRQLAIAYHDGRILLANTRTFTPIAIIEHNTVIDQSLLPPEHRAPIWEEIISASRERSYALRSQPVSPPLSRIKASTEPNELGIAEASFNCDASYLATRDERMLNTVWIWNMSTLSAHAVLIQHNNVRKMQWHPSRPETLLLDRGESVACCFNANTCDIPVSIGSQLRGTPAFSWLPTPPEAKSAILGATKGTFNMIYPEGRDNPVPDHNVRTLPLADGQAFFEEGVSEDSILEMLSGRRPLPPKTEPSYTEMVDLETSAGEADSSIRLEDTFREKRPVGKGAEKDPLDDSDIF